MHTFWLVHTYDLLEDRRIDDVIIKTFFPYILILYYIKQIDSKLPCVCSVIDHRGRQNVVGCASCATFLFLPHFDVVCDLLQTHGNLEMYLLIIYFKILRHYFSR